MYHNDLVSVYVIQYITVSSQDMYLYDLAPVYVIQYITEGRTCTCTT